MIIREVASVIIIAVMSTVLALRALEKFEEHQDEKKIHYVCVEHYDADTGEKIKECNIK